MDDLIIKIIGTISIVTIAYGTYDATFGDNKHHGLLIIFITLFADLFLAILFSIIQYIESFISSVKKCIKKSKEKKIKKELQKKTFSNVTQSIIKESELSNTITDLHNFKTFNSVEKSTIAKNQTYVKVNLITDYEKELYKILNKMIDKEKYTILSKIRLADLLNTISSNNKAFYKISSKHIDFAIANVENLEIKILIELDDKTHNNPERMQRDEFINKNLAQNGYKVLRITNLDGYEIKETIEYLLDDKIKAGVYFI